MKTNSGFIALMSVIIISAILLLIVTNQSLTGFYVRSNILDSELKEKSFALAEACADTAILKLANNPAYIPNSGGESINVGSDNCVIQSISVSSPKTINVRADYKNYVTKLKIVLNPDLSVFSFEEVL